MIKKLLVLLLSASVLAGFAGETGFMKETRSLKKLKMSSSGNTNVVSLGLLGLGFYNISLKYEYTIQPWCAVRVHGGMMIPHSSSVLNQITSAQNTSSASIENEIWGWHVKPEFIFYTGSGAPDGYYIGLYGKVDQYGLTVPVTGSTNKMSVTGDVFRVGGGMIMGYQWLIADRVSIDWWFLGLGIDSYTLSLSSKSEKDIALSDADKAEIKKSMDDIKGGGTITYPSNKEVKATLPSFWMPCFRFGLSVGYAF